MRILHLATDDKFVDHALLVFEKVFPRANEVLIFSPKISLEYVKLRPDRIVIKRSSFFNTCPKLPRESYENYDLVVLHCLHSLLYPEVKNIPRETPIVWLGWGADYYNDLLGDVPLVLERTKTLSVGGIGRRLKRKAASVLKGTVRDLKISPVKVRAIERISIFSPVLPNEYRIVANSRKWRRFPEIAVWNYGTIEDNLVKGFEGQEVDGNSILVGNSATVTGNHVEVFDLLLQLGIRNRKIVTPLSYGDELYGKKLIQIGMSYFSDQFEPLADFMPIELYVSTIKKCGFVIMNHIRQQAVGNIVIMLYLGARVFVRQESPVYEFFKNMGVSLSTVQELEVDPVLLSTPLTAAERSTNRALVSDYWSRDRAYERTRKLVAQARSMIQDR